MFVSSPITACVLITTSNTLVRGWVNPAHVQFSRRDGLQGAYVWLLHKDRPIDFWYALYLVNEGPIKVGTLALTRLLGTRAGDGGSNGNLDECMLCILETWSDRMQ